jgi:hypothetical protein
LVRKLGMLVLSFVEDCAESAKANPEPAFSGIADACSEIEMLTNSVKRALNVEALGKEVTIRCE